MESPDQTQTQTDASASRKRRLGEENDVPPPSVQRAGNAQPRRPLAALGAARDAPEREPQREFIPLSDGERDELLAYLATGAATQPAALRLDEAAPPRRVLTRRTATKADNVEGTAAAAVAAASAPREKASQAGTGPTFRKDPHGWVYLVAEEQRKWTIEYLREKNCLDLADEVINTVSRLYFDNRETLSPLECCNDMREAALTKASWNRLINKICNYMKAYDPDRADPEPAHGPILRLMWAELQKVGITTSGHVEGKLAGLGVEGEYHRCHGNGKRAKLSAASSLFHKLWIVAATRDKLDPIIKQTIDCSFGNATANSGEIGTLRSDAHGSFGGAAKGAGPLCKRYVDPRLAKVANEGFLGRGAVPRDTKLLIGNFGKDVIRHAIQRGCFAKYACCPSRRHFNLRRDGVGLHAIDAAWSSKTRVERAPLRDDVAVGPRRSAASTSAASIFWTCRSRASATLGTSPTPGSKTTSKRSIDC